MTLTLKVSLPVLNSEHLSYTAWFVEWVNIAIDKKDEFFCPVNDWLDVG